MAFADILTQISEETDRTTLDAMAKKYPSLRKFAESGEILEGLRPRLKALHETYENDPALAITETENWRTWKQDKWPLHAQQVADLQAALTEAQTRIADFEARTETDMTAEEIKEVVKTTLKEFNVASTADVDKRINEVVDKTVNPRLTSTVDGLTNRFEEVFDKIEDVLQTHRQTFPDDRIRAKQVFDYMRENKLTDVETAYKAMTADKYTAKQKTEQDQALAKAKEDGIAEGRKAAITSSGRANPVDGKGSQAPQGALMRRWEVRQKELKEQPLSRKLGSGAAARAGSQEYREKEAAQTAA